MKGCKSSSGNVAEKCRLRTLLLRLLREQAGNALGITAAAILLLVCLAGSGTDIARAYMTRTSLQNACDAGVLAGRKAMSKTGNYTDVEKAKANKMFNFNFNPLATDASNIVFNSSANTSGQVLATAQSDMPMTIMTIFGFPKVTLTVACSAELQMASADVMFVLDTTGSMRWDPDNVGCCNLATSKLNGLRDAVRDFYKTVAAAVTDKNNTRIRFGFVPYSSTVNARDLVNSGLLPTSYFANTADYQSRMALFNTPVYTANTPTTAAPVTETYSSNITQSNCNNYGVNKFPTSGSNPVTGGGPAPTATTSTTYAYLSWTLVSGNGSNALGTCRRTRTVTTTTYTTRYRLTAWRWAKATGVDVSAFKSALVGSGNTVLLATGVNTTSTTVPNANTLLDLRALALANGANGVSGVTTAGYTWNGCIEERQTVQQLSMSPVPSGALDLDMTNAPANDASRWKLYLEALEYYRNNYSSYDQGPTATAPSGFGVQPAYCPQVMKPFTNVDVTDPNTVPAWIETQLTGMAASGFTYHDIGMIWGGRLGNPSGIFSSNVNADSTKYPSVSRHIIFMTDGIMEPNVDAYNAYGTELYDQRIGPAGATGGSTGTLKDYHNNRFLAVCERIKSMGYTIWVIGFGTSLTDPMKTCSTSNRAYQANNTTDLKNTFKYIAGQVADLRINK